MERVAILPFENLTSDAELDWVSAASSAILAYDLTGPRGVAAIEAASIREARLKPADRYVEGYITARDGSLEFHASIEDPRKVKTVRTLDLTAPRGNIVPTMNQVARDLAPGARQFPACKADAMQIYAEALHGGASYEAAVKADPACSPLYLAWAESLVRSGDREGAGRVSKTALQLPGLDPIGRAQLEFVAADAKGDAAARLQALRSLTLLLPSDLDLLRNIAAAELSDRDFPDAVRSLEAVTRADPGDAQAWNMLGYTKACTRDAKGAREALERYQELLPAGGTNGIDSLGEVSFFLGDFASAERYFLEAQQKNPAEFGGRELLKAAEARMMTGDLAAADKIFAGAPNRPALERAQWEFLTGRRKEAMARLATPKNSREALQAAIWKAQTGQGAAPDMGTAPLGRAATLLLSGKFADAAPILEQLYRAANPGADGQIRTLLAWAYVQTGRRDEAAKLLDRYPIPLGSDGEPALASLVFPRFVQLRGEILNSQPDRQLAARYAGD